MRPLAARTLAASLVALALLLVLAPPAGAHVELEPGEAEAGATVTLTFSFHHGLDGSATTALAVQIPEGAVIVDVPAKEGWTSDLSEEGTVVTWSGGSVPDGTEAEFPVVVRLPTQPGEVRFPTIQTTEAGELAWISAEEGESEDAHPAPRLVLTAGEAATASTVDTSSTTRAARDLPRTILEAEQRDDGSSSPLWWVLSGVAAIVAIGVGGTILSRRMRS